jgi:hypothetical protein
MKTIGLSLFGMLFMLNNLCAQNQPIQLSVKAVQAKTTLSEIIDFKIENCPIFQVHFIVVPPEKNDIVEVINKGNELAPRTLELLKTAEKGAIIYIEKIDSLGGCIEYQFRDPNFVIEVI